MYKAGVAVNKPACIYLHAEIAALLKVRDWSKAFRIFVARYTKDGKPALAKPCPLCSTIIRKETGIQIIEYTS